MTAYLQGFCAPGVTPVVDILDPPHYADPGRPEIARLQDAARHQGYPGGLLRKYGVSDGRFYGQPGIAAVAFGVDGAGQHGPDEYADLTTVMPYYRALREFLGAPEAAAGRLEREVRRHQCHRGSRGARIA